jgi:S-(hydroxymethyl)glutathione dehydrogenase/alcohol dehydrogenase
VRLLRARAAQLLHHRGGRDGRGTLLDGTRRLSLNGQRLNHFLGVSSFAEYAVVPESGAVAVAKDMPLDRAALVSCAVLTGVGAVLNTAKVPAGARVAVFGCGGVGLNIVQGARIAGAERIVAVDVTDDKLAVASRFGATDVVDARQHRSAEAIRDLAAGSDHAFEALGREETIRQAWRSLDVGGEVIVVGLMRHGATLTIDADPLVNEQGIRGCYFGSSVLQRDVPALVDRYLAGDLLLDELISQRSASTVWTARSTGSGGRGGAQCPRIRVTLMHRRRRAGRPPTSGDHRRHR